MLATTSCTGVYQHARCCTGLTFVEQDTRPYNGQLTLMEDDDRPLGGSPTSRAAPTPCAHGFASGN
eukprot:364810-Chlamydomonas_euryale.AAC.17